MFCQNCGKEIPEGVFACPSCGCSLNKVQNLQHVENTQYPESGKYHGNTQYPTNIQKDSMPPTPNTGTTIIKKKKTGWLIAIAVVAVVFIAVIVAIIKFDGDSSEKPSTNDSSNYSETITTTTPTSEKESTTSKDTKASDFFKVVAGYNDAEIQEKTISFIDANNKYFPCSTNLLPELQKKSETHFHAELSKNISKYNNMFVYFGDLPVNTIKEYDDKEMTYLHFIDDSFNSYIGYYMGSLPNVFDDDIVSVYGVPIDIVYFSNKGGGTTEAIMIAISYCGNQTISTTEVKADDFDKNSVEYQLKSNPYNYFSENQIPMDAYVNTESSPLNVRESYSSDSKIIDSIPKYTDVYVLGDYSGWAYIEYESDSTNTLQYGWVNQSYLKYYYQG